MFYLNPNWTVFEKYTHLRIYSMAVDLFAELGHRLANVSSTHEETSSVRSLVGTSSLPARTTVYDILQLNVLHTGRLMFQLAQYSRYRSIFSYRKLLTKLLKTVRQVDENSRTAPT
ncbi:hypothetical protein T265_02756 [Opisthorchis viverrini]|uniref:Uncharacterized protein n=1 Tax=Opisthorchis viverrini TaxID=6198 RepID=A0A074ZUX0_OPIVI|nr:hypothetical protein T265_02756 [Opisthorchis viverrini]KER30946.1 hypothetical protein T265_02756 [Opisthorchis viverrini]